MYQRRQPEIPICYKGDESYQGKTGPWKLVLLKVDRQWLIAQERSVASLGNYKVYQPTQNIVSWEGEEAKGGHSQEEHPLAIITSYHNRARHPPWSSCAKTINNIIRHILNFRQN